MRDRLRGMRSVSSRYRDWLGRPGLVSSRWQYTGYIDPDDFEYDYDEDGDEYEYEDRTDGLDDTLFDLENLGPCLEAMVLSVTKPGRFSTSDEYRQFENPGLTIDGLGLLGLPLSFTEVDRIKSIAREVIASPGNESGAGHILQNSLDENFAWSFGGNSPSAGNKVQKSWEVDASFIHLRNPLFKQVLNNILKDALFALGIHSQTNSIVAQLHRLKIYDKDSQKLRPYDEYQTCYYKDSRNLLDKRPGIESPKDSVKEPGVFGTLAIYLPCQHSGGDSSYERRDKPKKKYGHEYRDVRGEEHSYQSMFKLYYSAWYADVVHKRRPVTSGHLAVLYYDLVDHGPNDCTPRSAGGLDKPKERLIELFKTWDGALSDNESLREYHAPTLKVYLLDGKYDDAKLRRPKHHGRRRLNEEDDNARLIRPRHHGQRLLNEEDRSIVKAFEKAPKHSACDVYLANIERKVTIQSYERIGYDLTDEEDGAYEYKESVEIDSTVEVRTVVTLKGKVLAELLSIDKDDIVQQRSYKRKPDWQQSHGSTTTMGYHDSALIIIPRSACFVFLLHPNLRESAKVVQALDRCLIAFHEEPTTRARNDLVTICNYYHRKHAEKSQTADPEVLAKFAECAVALGDVKMFAQIARLFTDDDASDLFLGIGAEIDNVGSREERWDECVINSIGKFKSIHERSDALKELVDGISIYASEKFRGIIDGTIWIIKRKLRERQVDAVSPEDVYPLPSFAAEGLCDERVFDIADDHVSASPFMVALLVEMFRDSKEENGRFCQIWAKIRLMSLFHAMISTFSIAEFLTRQTVDGGIIPPPPKGEALGGPIVNWQREEQRRSNDSRMVEAKHLVWGPRLARLCAEYHEVDPALAVNFLLRLESQICSNMEVRGFVEVVLPFLNSLIGFIHVRKIDIDAGGRHYHRFFKAVLLAYITQYVGVKPERDLLGRKDPSTLDREHCKDCAMLVWFLDYEGERVQRVTGDQQRLEHLKAKADFRIIDCTTEDQGKTLVLTKSPEHVAHYYTGCKAALNRPSTRFYNDRVAKRRMKSLGETNLRRLLEDRYEDIVEMRILRPADPPRLKRKYQEISRLASEDGDSSKKQKPDPDWLLEAWKQAMDDETYRV